MTDIKRITVNISPATVEALELVITREGVTLTEALRRLVGYGDLVYRASRLDGKTVLLRKDDESQEVILL